MNQEEVTVLPHHRPQGCAVDEHVPHHERSVRAVGDPLLCCKPPVCAVGDHVFPETKKEKVKKHLNPHSKNLM